MALKLNGTNSVAAPAYAGADADTGLQCGTDEVNLVTGGTARLKIDSSGSVGVGSTNPLAKFHIARGSDDNSILYITGADTSSEYVALGVGAGYGMLTAGGSGSTSTNLILRTASSGTEAERMRIGSDGNCSIGTTTNTNKLRVHQGSDSANIIVATGADESSEFISLGINSGVPTLTAGGVSSTSASLAFRTANNGTESERMRIDSSGRLLINHTADTAPVGYASKLQLCDTSYQGSSFSMRRDGGNSGPALVFSKSRASSKGGNTIVQNNDDLGVLRWFAADGTDSNSEAAQIQAQIDDTPGSNDTPGRLIFKTTANGASDVSERMRIDSSGNVGIGNSAPSNYSSTGRNLVVGTGSSAAGLTVASGATNTGNIYFAAGSTGDDQVRGQIRYNHSTEAMDLYTDASLRMRIANDGKVGIGHSTPQFGLTLAQSSNDTGAIGWEDAGNSKRASIRCTTSGDALTFATGTSDAERMRIDSSGRLLIGTTTEGNTSADNLTVADSGHCGITIRSGASSQGALYFSDATSGNHEFRGYIIFDQGIKAMRFGTNASERMRIDGSGMVQVGGTTSADSSNKVEITSSSGGTIGFLRNDTSTVQGDPIGAIGFYGNDSNGTYQDAARIEVNADGDHATGDKPAKIEFKVSADGGNTPIQRFIIESDGEQRMFSANPSYTLVLNNGASAGTSYLFLEGRHSATSNTGQTGTRSLSITTNGNIYNTNNSYGQISDVKLKENIVDASSQWDDIKNVQVRNFNFKEETGHSTHTQIGVVAQELETVSPGLVYDTPDVDADRNDLGTVTKTVNYSVLYMKAVKALQEAQTRIEALETQQADLLARVTALEAA